MTYTITYVKKFTGQDSADGFVARKMFAEPDGICQTQMLFQVSHETILFTLAFQTVLHTLTW